MKRAAFVLVGLMMWVAAGCGGVETVRTGEGKVSYLFGLDESEIVTLGAHYSPDVDSHKLLGQLQAPFACDRFGQLCQAVGERDALAIVELQWTLSRQHVSRDVLKSQLQAALDEAHERFIAGRLDDHPVDQPAPADQSKTNSNDGAIGSQSYAVVGLHCSIPSVRELIVGNHKIITEALLTDLGTIALTTITTTHYVKFLWLWIRSNASSLCIRNPSMTRWISATGVYTSYDASDYCSTNVQTVSRSLAMWVASGDKARGDGCGDYNSSTIYKCACDAQYID